LTDGVDVIHRAAGGLHRAADVMVFAATIDQAADGAARRVIDAGNPAGTDGYEAVFICPGGVRPRQRADNGGGNEKLSEFFEEYRVDHEMIPPDARLPSP